MTLFGDILKGFLPVLGAHLLLESVELASLCAVVCFCGHCWSPYLAFRGGKGVATAAGGMLALSPFIVAGAVLTWSLLFMWKRIASVSALGGAAVLPLLSLGIDPPLWPVCTALSLGILVRHRDNIRRLRDGRAESWR